MVEKKWTGVLQLLIVNKFLNDLDEDLDFKKYANKNELNLS